MKLTHIGFQFQDEEASVFVWGPFIIVPRWMEAVKVVVAPYFHCQSRIMRTEIVQQEEAQYQQEVPTGRMGEKTTRIQFPFNNFSF